MKLYNKDYQAVAKSNLFNGKWYLKHNRDLKRAKVDPVLHYVHTGWKENRPCTKYFNGQKYLEMNPDVPRDMNPLAHYERFGKQEGRPVDIRQKNRVSFYSKFQDKMSRILVYPIEVEMECHRLKAELKSKR